MKLYIRVAPLITPERSYSGACGGGREGFWGIDHLKGTLINSLKLIHSLNLFEKRLSVNRYNFNGYGILLTF